MQYLKSFVRLDGWSVGRFFAVCEFQNLFLLSSFFSWGVRGKTRGQTSHDGHPPNKHLYNLIY